MKSPHTTRRLLSCPHCKWQSAENLEGMLDWLRRAGLLRRASDPEAELVAELLTTTRARFVCPACGHRGLDVGLDIALDESCTDWDDPRQCADCGEVIPTERLKVLPQADLCTPCQQKADRGESFDPPTFPGSF